MSASTQIMHRRFVVRSQSARQIWCPADLNEGVISTKGGMEVEWTSKRLNRKADGMTNVCVHTVKHGKSRTTKEGGQCGFATECLMYDLGLIKAMAVLLCLLGRIWHLPAQEPVDHIASIVYLDSIVVTAQQEGFSVTDFIRMVRDDQSFYQAFRHLRSSSYLMRTEMQYLDRKGRRKATYQALHQQDFQAPCRTMQVLEEQIEGRIRKREDRYKHYTTRLYDRLFVTHGRVCAQEAPSVTARPTSGMAGHVEELKKLIFSPGTKSAIPFIGNKTAIFSQRMIDRYDFHIRSEQYLNGQDAYVFEVQLKPAYRDGKQNKTVIKQLVTYFSKEDFQVLGRQMRLAHRQALYRFDVQFDIALDRLGDHYVPKTITYDGFWRIPARREKARFMLTFSAFNP